MIGAVIGDLVGSIYEGHNIKHTSFPFFSPYCRFTDDSVMSIAVADALLNGYDIGKTMRRYGRMFPCAGYGGKFSKWLFDDEEPAYNSFGNGSAMRASTAGWASETLADALELATQTALPSHNHPEGIRGAQVIAGGIWLLRHGATKADIREWVESMGYELGFTLDAIRPFYHFDVTCMGSVPQAVVAFLESTDFESAVRLAISIGGDSDTIACMAGALAEAAYGIPDHIVEYTVSRMPRVLYEPLAAFEAVYGKLLPSHSVFPNLPAALAELSAKELAESWQRIAANYRNGNQEYLPYNTFLYNISGASRYCARMTNMPAGTIDLATLIAYFAEGSVDDVGCTWMLNCGHSCLAVTVDTKSENPTDRYAITALEAVISTAEGDSRSYIRRRTNVAADKDIDKCITSFDKLLRLQRSEYADACRRRDYEQAWRIFALNRMLLHMC